MRILRLRGRMLAGLLGLVLGLSLLGPQMVAAAVEESFDLLQIGSQTYRNVTVTTKSKDYFFIMHSAGMNTIKVAQLTPEQREQLGYPPLPKPKESATNATAWAKQTIAKLETPKVKAMEAQVVDKVVDTWRSQIPLEKLPPLPPITRTLLLEAAGIVAAVWLFNCYCLMLICQKAGQKPGVLVWLPVLQMFPLLRAAGMSFWWFLAYFVPLLNVVAHFLWCLKIASARNKTALVGVLLFLPVLNLLAFLYLAFSGGGGEKHTDRRIEVMSLEAA